MQTWAKAIPLLVIFTSAVPAAGQSRPIPQLLTMTCHPLLQGEPMAEETDYILKGDDPFSKVAARTERISTGKQPLFLSRDLDRGIPILSWAQHVREGNIITRRVYWKTGNGPRRLRMTWRYDFDKQTISATGERGDLCHHARS